MEVKIKCIGLDNRGRGEFIYQNKKYSCAGLLENEEALVKIEKNRTECIQILKASSYRKEIACSSFKRCGGCQFQHVTREFETNFKQNYIQSLFPKQIIQPLLVMDNPMHYRHKVIATFMEKNKKIQAGIYEENTHSVCLAENCLIQHEKANEIIKTIVKLANKMKYSAYNEDRHTGLLRHCLIRVSSAYDEVLVCLVTGNSVFPGSRNFVNELRKIHPEITTVVQNINTRSTSVVLGNQEKVLYGTGMIKDRLDDLNFQISSKTFYQVNPEMTLKLYKKALELADIKKEERVLDAYCGIGTISLFAARLCKEVVGVEINPVSIENAKKNARFNKIQNVHFYAQDCGEFMRKAASQKEKFDTVIMDPAREGSDTNFLESLCILKPKKIVYISCGPDTQKRDVEYLKKKGYQIQLIQPVDLFPSTCHVENICLMSRKEK